MDVTYDITGAAGNIEEFLELQEWLDTGVYLVGTDTTASVNITIERQENKQLFIWLNDIEIRNKPEGLQVLYITKGGINVSILGPNSEIEPVTRNTLKPYIDLKGYSSGTYFVDIKADISENVTISDTPKVLLDLIPEA